MVLARSAPLALASSLVLAGLAWGAQAEEAPSAEAAVIDPAAEEILAAVSGYLADAGTLQLTAVSFFDEIQPSGMAIKRVIVHEVQLRRPDRLAFTATFDTGAVRRGWYDGETLTVAYPQEGRYVRIEAPDTIDALLDQVQEEYGFSLPLADILYSDMYAAQQPYILSALYLGERRIADTAYDHISVESVGADWQLWTETGGEPIPRRLVMHFVEAEGQPEYMATFRDWSAGEPIDDAAFIADIPEDWEQVAPRAR